MLFNSAELQGCEDNSCRLFPLGFPKDKHCKHASHRIMKLFILFLFLVITRNSKQFFVILENKYLKKIVDSISVLWELQGDRPGQSN
jgi:hypothetical protein